MPTQIDVRAWKRIAWFFVAFIVGGIGIGCVWWPASQAIGARHARALELYDEANAIDTATRRASQLNDARSRLTTDLAQLGGVRSEGALTAAVLRLLHQESTREGVQIREVAPDEVSQPSHVERSVSSQPRDPLLPADVSIAVRGPYRNVVALVADLPRHDVLIDVRDIQLRSVTALQKRPDLDVTLRTTIYRLVSLPITGTSGVLTLR